MKIAVSSPSFSLTDFEVIAEKISKHFKAWEIVAEGKHYLWDIKQKLSSYELEILVHAPLSDINIGSLNKAMMKESLKQIAETIKTASQLALKLVTIHPACYSPLGVLAKAKVKELCKQSLKELGKVGREYGVRIALENMPKQDFTMCHTLGESIELINDNVELCFDVGHANTANAIAEFLTYSKEYADIHLHDNLGIKDEHLPLGKGNIDFKKILNLNYNNFYVIECRNLEEAVESKKYLENLF
ncbi:MAG: sugar phosphate isomerase/epimerase [Candidatus Thermoplasmatota archaeon]|nr:sugar phosphate isomerase/epimerase [Candidatus Thermoplasmatota archaeon]